MIKSKISILLFLFVIHTINAQQQTNDDSLKAIIHLQKNDTAEVNTLVYLSNQQTQFDSSIKYAKQGLLLAEELHYKKGEADCLFVIAAKNTNFSTSITYALSALKIYELLHDNVGIASAHLILQANYWNAGDYKNALLYAFAGERIAETNKVNGVFVFTGHRLAPLFLAEISQIYVLKNQLDSALFFTQKSIQQNELFNGARWGFPVYLMATIQTTQGDYKSALENFRLSISLSVKNNFPKDTIQIFSGMSTLFKKMGQSDSSIYYAQIVNRSMANETEPKNLLEAIANLASAYKVKREIDSAVKYLELSFALKDSIYSKEKDKELQNITFNERLKQQEILSAQTKYKVLVQLYSLLAGLLILLLIAFILWRNNRHKQKANIILQQQKAKVETTLSELKSTQAQLIQSEKMASLGELTAGIAHEIQNPLNFVNNFSEINEELLIEIKDELSKGKIEDAIVLANDVIENQKKIYHHGKRADAIVKGMLQHSRSSSGQKEPTDINALADEYLRLSYHGLRAKDKSFNTTLKTDYDETIGKINIIPQDIGRVILNLITNAFYAAPLPPEGGFLDPDYVNSPTVWVSTSKNPPLGGRGAEVLISIKDNGPGIPQKILDKIFQPFFTTKPTGQGTGLGLSLSYDIVKAHGGEINVKAMEGEGAEFIIRLPV